MDWAWRVFPWPLRSPDLNRLDFWYWGKTNKLVYKTLEEDEHELDARIFYVDAEIQNDPNEFQNVRESMQEQG